MSYISTGNGSRQPMFLTVSGVLSFLSCISVALRWYCRAVHVRKLGADDYLIAAALLVTAAMVIMGGFNVSFGTGRHMDDLPLDKILIPTLKHWYAFQIVYPVAIGLVKFSILAQYYRIFVKQPFRHAVVGVGTFVLVYTVVVVFVNAFECHTKPWRAWHPTFPEGCNNLPAAYFSTAGINILTDLTILVMPFPVLMRLNLRPKRKWALVAVFLTGSLASAASIVRLHALYIYTITHDPSYDSVYVLLWSQVEANVAIISASAPSLRPLFSPLFKGSSYYREYEGTAHLGYAMRGSRYPWTSRPNTDGVMELSSRDAESQKTRGRPSMPAVPCRALHRAESEEHILKSDASILKTVVIESTSDRMQSLQ